MSKKFYRVEKGSEVDIKVREICEKIDAHIQWKKDVVSKLGFKDGYSNIDKQSFTPSLLGFDSDEKPEGYKSIRKSKNGRHVYYPLVSNKQALEVMKDGEPDKVAKEDLNKLVGFVQGISESFGYMMSPPFQEIDGVFYFLFESHYDKPEHKPNFDGGMVEIKEWEYLKAYDEHKAETVE